MGRSAKDYPLRLFLIKDGINVEPRLPISFQRHYLKKTAMPKNILLLLCLIGTFLLQAQTQITNYQEEAYQSPIKKVFKWQDRVFYAFENGAGKVEVWELANEQLSKVYETPFVLCDFELDTWSIYEDKLFLGGYISMRCISFLTGEMVEEVFSTDPHFYTYTIRYEFDGSLAKARIRNEIEYVFDMDFQELVPAFRGDVVYKSNTSYYYVTSNGSGRILMKRPFFETTSTEIGPGFTNYSPHVYNEVLYFQGQGDAFYRIYKDDSFDTFSNFTFLINLYQGEGGQFWGIDQTTSGGVLQVIDSTSMEILSSKNASNFIPFHIYTANSEKVLFRSIDPLDNVARLAYWDIPQDTIRYIDTHPYIYGIQVEDSLLFNVIWDYQNPKMDVINANTLEVKGIDLPAVAQNEFRGERQLFKKEASYYLALYDFDHGFGFLEYDYQEHTVTADEGFPTKNLGTGTTIASTGNTLYLDNFDVYSRSIQVYDPAASDGMYIHEIEGGVDFDIQAIDGSFYYYADHEFNGTPPSDSNYVDLIRFDAETKTTTTLVEALSYSPYRDFVRMEVGGRYILSPNYWTNENLTAYDTKNDLSRAISPQQKEILRRASIVTENWIYALTSSSGVRRIYKMQVDDIDNVALIYENSMETPELVPVNGDTIHLLVADSLYAYDGQQLTNYFAQPETTFFQGSAGGYQSADKQYVAYKFSSPDSLGIFLYDRWQDEVTTFRVQDWLTLHSDNTDLYFGEGYFYHRDRNSNQEYELWSYNITTQERTVQSYDFFPAILSLHDGEVHVEHPADNRIYIYTADLELIEEVSMGSLLNVWNYYNYPLRQMLNNPRVMYSYRPQSGSDSHERLLNLYDAKTRTVTPYFDCDAGLRLHSIIPQGGTVYCVASNAEEGNQLYRIEIEDYISSTEKDPLDPVTEPLQLFPNPTNDMLYLGQPLDQIEILDVQGRLIYVSKQTLQSVPVNHLTPGFYVIKGQYQNRYFTGKFIKGGF